MGLDAIHDWIGSDKHKGVGGGPWFREIRTNTSLESHRENGRLRQLFHTPAGTLEGIQRYDEGSRSWHPVKMPVAGVEDIEAITAWYADRPPGDHQGGMRLGKGVSGENVVRNGGTIRRRQRAKPNDAM